MFWGNNPEQLNPDRLGGEALRLETFLRGKLIGQPRAVENVIANYDYSLSPLREPKGPLMAALYLGPSGVGKTYMPELLAEYLFGSREAFTKIECAKFQEAHQLSFLIGAPPGYLGYNHPNDPRYKNPPLLDQEMINRFAVRNFLKTDRTVRDKQNRIKVAKQQLARETDPVKRMEITAFIDREAISLDAYAGYAIDRQRKMSIILFDEIEKAHPALFNFLLEVTSTGRTTLDNGSETTFYNSFVIMTSNLGSRSIAKQIKGQSKIGFSSGSKLSESIYDVAMGEVRKFFAPEFLGRIEDNIVVFNPLDREKLAEIRDLQMKDLMGRLAAEFPVDVGVAPEVVRFILEKSIDHPEYGARLIEHKIRKYLERPMARMINSRQIKRGDIIMVKLDGGEIVFERTKGENLSEDEPVEALSPEDEGAV